MNIQRFYAPTAREALAKARRAFGDGTLILSNRPTSKGIEVVATTDGAIKSIMSEAPPSPPSSTPTRQRPAASVDFRDDVNDEQDDASQLAMSTLSFQGYARERMLRRRHEEMARVQSAPLPRTTPPPPAAGVRSAAAHPAPAGRVIPKSVKRPAAAPTAAPPSLSQGIVNELNAVKELIEERFNTLAWLGQSRQDPIQSNLMHKLIRAGYSPALARAVLSKLPADTRAHGAMRWVMDVLAHNLKTDSDASPIHVEGGIYALVGSTGVGKTTTAAKLAGLCASVHGPGSVGLITLDTYRIGAHEQLRTYGRMLGVVAHLAHDGAALQDLLGLLSNKKMVLIDTSGVSPRDPRKRDMLSVLDLPGVQRLLVLNAGGHGDTLDETVSSFRSQTGIQHAILSKLDEAAKLGPAIDASIRHQLLLRGVTTGQKVPEDWEPADAAMLVRMSMRAATKSAFDPQASDLGFFFSQPMTAQRAAHA